MDSVFYFLFDVPVFFYGICTSLFLVSRFFFALFYRNVPIDPEYTPSVTIVIPCFNEEKFITRTIRCALDQDYPEDKLKVIVVTTAPPTARWNECWSSRNKRNTS